MNRVVASSSTILNSNNVTQSTSHGGKKIYRYVQNSIRKRPRKYGRNNPHVSQVDGISSTWQSLSNTCRVYAKRDERFMQ